MWREDVQDNIKEVACAQTANRLTPWFCICVLQMGVENCSGGIKERSRECFEIEMKKTAPQKVTVKRVNLNGAAYSEYSPGLLTLSVLSGG